MESIENKSNNKINTDIIDKRDINICSINDKDEKIDVINIADRNAYDSWYGYHYQAMCALLYFLEEIGMSLEKNEDPNEIYLRIEYIEDFIIFNNKGVDKIFQAKKTLTEKIMEEVYADFLLEQAYLENENIQYIIVSDNKVEKISLDKMKEIYTEVKKKYLGEIGNVISNINNKEFLITNLNLKNSDSLLKNTRQVIRNILDKKIAKKYTLNKIELHDFEKYLLNELQGLAMQINNFDQNGYIEKFYLKVKNSKKEILTLEKEIDLHISRISKLIGSGVKSEKDIRSALVNLIYNKLKERVKSRKEYILTYKYIKDEILALETNKYIWERAVYKGRTALKNKMEEICKVCAHKNTDKCNDGLCIIKNIDNINFEESLDNFNLELTTENIAGENLLEVVCNKFANEKYKFFKQLLLEFKDNKKIDLGVNEEKNVIKVCMDNDKLAMISWLNGSDYYDELAKCYVEHMNIYREYDEVLTKEYEDEIDFDDIGIIKNTYEDNYISPYNKDSVIKSLNVKFVPYNKFREKK